MKLIVTSAPVSSAPREGTGEGAAPGCAHKITVADSAGQAVTFLEIAGQRFLAEWHRQVSVLSLKGEDGVERNIRVRSQSVTRFDGDADTGVAIEAGIGAAMYCSSLTVKPDVPGQAVRGKAQAGGAQTIRSQITGKVVKVLVKPNDQVEAGQALLIVEAMKMENRVFATMSGKITQVAVKDGDAVQTGKELLKITHG